MLDEGQAEAILGLLGGASVGAEQPGGDAEEPQDEIEQGMAEATEGRKVTARHVRRERSAWLRRKKIEAAGERPVCEACGFDFEAFYGDRGHGFIECHHLTPVSELNLATRTRLEDLALLCANCHRMIHASRPWIGIAKLRELLTEAQTGNERGPGFPGPLESQLPSRACPAQRRGSLHHAAHVGHAAGHAAAGAAFLRRLGDDRLGDEDVLGDRRRVLAAPNG